MMSLKICSLFLTLDSGLHLCQATVLTLDHAQSPVLLMHHVEHRMKSGKIIPACCVLMQIKRLKVKLPVRCDLSFPGCSSLSDSPLLSAKSRISSSLSLLRYCWNKKQSIIISRLIQYKFLMLCNSWDINLVS